MTIESIIERLEKVGMKSPKVMKVSDLNGYPDIYWKRAQKDALSGFEPDYTKPSLLKAYLEPWQYIIAVAIPCSLLPSSKTCERNQISSVSIMAWEYDYHTVIKDLISKALKGDIPYEVHLDNGPIPERNTAIKMGLAKPGRSQFLIHEHYGSAFHVAFILVNGSDLAEVDSSASSIGKGFKEQEAVTFELSSHCEDCNRCQNHCPGGALTGKADFNANQCVSKWTQQKGLLTEEQMIGMGRQLYGCDLCQLSCPANSPMSGNKSAILTRQTMNRVDPRTILKCTQKDFKEQYGHMGFSWRGHALSKRNALINIGNYGNLDFIQDLDDIIKTTASDQEGYLYQTAQWAKKRVLSRDSRRER